MVVAHLRATLSIFNVHQDIHNCYDLTQIHLCLGHFISISMVSTEATSRGGGLNVNFWIDCLKVVIHIPHTIDLILLDFCCSKLASQSGG